jgi:hypothetical protein
MKPLFTKDKTADKVVVEDDKSKGALALATAGAPLAIVTKPGTAAMLIVPPTEVATFGDVEEDDVVADKETSDRGLPIFRVLQSNSPQVGDEGTIPGAKAGMILNTMTNEVYDGKLGLYGLFVNDSHKYVAYIAREKDGTGGGFKSVHEVEDPNVQRALDDYMAANGHTRGKVPFGVDEETNKPVELVESFYLDCLLIKPNEDGSFPGEFGRRVDGSLVFQSTQIREHDSWKERLKGMTYKKDVPGQAPKTIKPKLQTHVWRIQTKLRTKGTLKWYVWSLTLGNKDADGVELDYEFSRLPTSNFLYKEASELQVAILEGGRTLAFEKDKAGESQPNNEGGSREGNGSDDIPFGNN